MIFSATWSILVQGRPQGNHRGAVKVDVGLPIFWDHEADRLGKPEIFVFCMVWDIFFFLGGGGSYEGKFVEIVDGVGNFFILVEFLCRILLIHYRLCNHLAIFERSDFLLPWSFVNSTTSSTILVSLLENPGPFGPMISLSVSHLRWRSGSGQNSKTFVMPPANPADPETQLRLGDLFQKKHVSWKLGVDSLNDWKHCFILF